MNYFLLGKNKKRKGPYKQAQLRDLWKAGKIPAGTLCCEKGGKEWLPIEKVKGIAKRSITGEKEINPGTRKPSKPLTQFPLKPVLACAAVLLMAGIGYSVFRSGNGLSETKEIVKNSNDSNKTSIPFDDPKADEKNSENPKNLLITNQPKDQIVTAGSAATFSIVADGSGLNFQWKRNGIDLPGATSTSYTIDHAQRSNEGNYSCFVSTKVTNLTSMIASLKVIPFQRGAGYRDEAIEKGASEYVFNAIDLGLAWLAKVQEQDGRWNSRKWGGAGHDLGCTGLALLAFLGDGNSHVQGKYRDNVKRALDWIVSNQKEDGNLGWKTFYEQGIATMALCEVCGLSRDPRYYNAAKLAIKHIIDKMGNDGGYGYKGPGNDTSVTGWQIMALKSAELADIHIPQEVWNKVKIYLKKSINPNGSTGYRYKSGPKNSMTAIGLFCRIFMKYPKDDPNITNARDLLHTAGPAVKKLYYLYYATYCMFQVGGDYWSKWNTEFRDPLIALQITSGDLMGSWGITEYNASRVYSTALSLMSLEVYQRFLPIYR